jgi:hypothetical protein
MMASAGPGFAGLAVLAADRAAGQGLDGGAVDKVKRGGRGYDLHGPDVFLGELADFGGRASTAAVPP